MKRMLEELVAKPLARLVARGLAWYLRRYCQGVAFHRVGQHYVVCVLADELSPGVSDAELGARLAQSPQRVAELMDAYEAARVRELV